MQLLFSGLRKYFIIFLIGVLVIGLLIYPLKCLTLVDYKRDTGIILLVRNNNEFTIEYTHSVQKTRVQEHIVIAPSKHLVLTSTTFQSLGVGLPFLPEEGILENQDGVFLLTDINRNFDSITLGVMSIAKQAIIFNEQKYRLNDYFIDGTFIKIRCETMSFIEILWQRWIGGKEVVI